MCILNKSFSQKIKPAHGKKYVRIILCYLLGNARLISFFPSEKHKNVPFLEINFVFRFNSMNNFYHKTSNEIPKNSCYFFLSARSKR